MTKQIGKVAVVGAGIGGLALAAALKKFGMQVDVYEQASKFARIGAGINVSPNAVVALAGLGLYEKLIASSHQPPSWLSCKSDTGEVIGDFPLGSDAASKYGYPFIQMHRADLHAALADAVPQEWVHFNKKLVDLKQSRDGVTLSFLDGSTVQADAVIAADGIHSRVREIILGKDEPIFTGRVAYRAVIPLERVAHIGLKPFVKWWGPDRHIVMYDINDREMYFVTSVPAGEWRLESWSAKGDVEELRAEFKDFHPHVKEVLNSCDEVYKWALYVRKPVKPWSDKNVVLMGDACHPMTPYMAQGAAMAIEDAVVLARCIQEMDDCASAFKLYESLRFSRTSKVQKESLANKFMQQQGDDPTWVYSYNAWTTPLSNASRV